MKRSVSAIREELFARRDRYQERKERRHSLLSGGVMTLAVCLFLSTLIVAPALLPRQTPSDDTEGSETTNPTERTAFSFITNTEFEKVKTGMTKEEVATVLGEQGYEFDNGNRWLYTSSGGDRFLLIFHPTEAEQAGTVREKQSICCCTYHAPPIGGSDNGNAIMTGDPYRENSFDLYIEAYRIKFTDARLFERVEEDMSPEVMEFILGAPKYTCVGRQYIPLYYGNDGSIVMLYDDTTGDAPSCIRRLEAVSPIDPSIVSQISVNMSWHEVTELLGSPGLLFDQYVNGHPYIPLISIYPTTDGRILTLQTYTIPSDNESDSTNEELTRITHVMLDNFPLGIDRYGYYNTSAGHIVYSDFEPMRLSTQALKELESFLNAENIRSKVNGFKSNATFKVYGGVGNAKDQLAVFYGSSTSEDTLYLATISINSSGFSLKSSYPFTDLPEIPFSVQFDSSSDGALPTYVDPSLSQMLTHAYHSLRISVNTPVNEVSFFALDPDTEWPEETLLSWENAQPEQPFQLLTYLNDATISRGISYQTSDFTYYYAFCFDMSGHNDSPVTLQLIGLEINLPMTEQAYTPILITQENWEEYFEFHDTIEVTPAVPSSGEDSALPSVAVNHYVILKKEYQSRINSTCSEVQTQLTGKHVTLPVRFSEDYSSFEFLAEPTAEELESAETFNARYPFYYQDYNHDEFHYFCYFKRKTITDNELREGYIDNWLYQPEIAEIYGAIFLME